MEEPRPDKGKTSDYVNMYGIMKMAIDLDRQQRGRKLQESNFETYRKFDPKILKEAEDRLRKILDGE